MLATLALLASLAPAADVPATQPAPFKPRPDEVRVEDAKHGFSLVVPKLWKPVEQPQPSARSIYVFQLPATGEARKATPSWIVTAEPLANVGDDLPAVCARVRQRIAARNDDPTLAVDQATVIAGHPGWTFEYATTLTVTITEGNAQRKEPVAVRVRDQVTIADGTVLEFVLTSDARGLPIRTRQVDRALSSLRVGAGKREG